MSLAARDGPDAEAPAPLPGAGAVRPSPKWWSGATSNTVPARGSWSVARAHSSCCALGVHCDGASDNAALWDYVQEPVALPPGSHESAGHRAIGGAAHRLPEPSASCTIPVIGTTWLRPRPRRDGALA